MYRMGQKSVTEEAVLILYVYVTAGFCLVDNNVKSEHKQKL